MVVEEKEKPGFCMPKTNPRNIPKCVGGQLTITVAGRGLLSIGKKKFHCVPGTAFLHTDCDPKVSYCVPEDSKGWHFLWISFTGNASAKIIRELNSAYGYFFLMKNNSLEKILYEFLQHSGARFFISPAEGAKIFFDLINELGFSSIGHPGSRGRRRLSREMKKEIVSAFSEPISTNTLAQRLGISREHMSRVFHRETGSTLQDFRAEQRLAAAMNLLEKSNCSCKEIASFCNYGSYSSFYRAFMAVHHSSPEEYRKRRIRDKNQNNAKDPSK